MDKYNAMQVFVRVAEAGSFTAVANQENVARSVITRQIAGLETQLRTKLITRSTRSLTLTTAGAAYLEKCRVILNMVDAAESSLLDEKAVARGRIRLGLPLSFGLQRLMPELTEFAKQQPHIQLAMDFSDRRANLIEEGIDVSIRITANLDQSDIVRKLGTCRLMTVASPDYVLQHGQVTHPRELQNHECLAYSINMTPTSWDYQVEGQLSHFPIRGRITANNGVALTKAAAEGLGITRQPDFIAQPFIARGEVVEILSQFASEPLGIYAVLPSNRYIPHRVSVLIEHLSQALV
ncbi:LysR family transcriptional regulator [Limnohabitans sp. TS-CS-82]|uniref:LysR family transcriptional regulator n=1 Tax=Limnohabitans sp. TS-CS-82 TaxID=2094193 RepID=UPI000CF28DD7|nr:LysR family transcriptional regulator [Limnohabitans sp. TS-CS-82]PQA81733.1 LysR family transcriptional regulator [Limnohabitans sp. TS-CS-82]